MSNYIIDFQSKQLTLLDSRFYTTEEGGYVPSVTTILQAYPKDAAYFQWLKKVGEDADEIRDAAGDRGSTVHKLIEKYNAGEEISLLNESGNISIGLSEWSMVERYIDFATRFPHQVIHSEQNYVSPKLGFAGTLDMVIDLNGKNILIDIKTSNAIYPTYWLQPAAYEKLITEAYGYNPIEASAVLWLNAKTRTNGSRGQIQGAGWQLIFNDQDNAYELFEATKKLWLAQNKDVQPKKLSYQLTHKK